MDGQQQRGFLRSYVLPALFLFALPLFAYWFSGHAVRSYDERVREAALESVRQDASLGDAERKAARDFYASIPASALCADAEANPGLADGLGVCSDYEQFGWMRMAANLSLLLGAGSVALVLACSGLSFISRPAQYWSFQLGWNGLRLTSSAQVVLQGALAVGLSYWTTALWLERYVPKLILIIAVLALVAMYRVLVAIFARVGAPLDIEGQLLSDSDAPELWQHVRELCQRLNTEPPAQIVGGIDDNFFVTEGRVSVSGTLLEGRTLYVSLSLLKTMEREEANAVLAHEMAHFSGGDTEHSKKLVPSLQRYQAYLEALAAGGLSMPVFYFMLFYWALFQLSLGKSSRERELRADRIAAEQTSKTDAAHALLRALAYSGYRAKVENELFGKDEKHERLDIPQTVLSGLTAYVSSSELANDLHDRTFPHPFDSHPTLAARLSALGVELAEERYAEVLLRPVAESWFGTIRTAPDLERQLWGEYQKRFAAAHELALAHRYRPASDEERELVLRHFPARTFEGDVRLTFEGVEAPGWPAPIAFDDVEECKLHDGTLGKSLEIKLNAGGTTKLPLRRLGSSRDDFMEAFGHYYRRHLIMKEHQATSAAEDV